LASELRVLLIPSSYLAWHLIHQRYELKSAMLFLVILRCSSRFSMVACIAGPTVEQRHI